MIDFAQRLSILDLDKRALLKELLSAATDSAIPGDFDLDGHEPGLRGERTLLSPQQEQLWFVDRIGSGKARNCLGLQIRISGPLDRIRLEQAIHTVVSRHEVLRLSIVAKEGKPEGIVVPAVDFKLPFRDLSNMPPLMPRTFERACSTA